MDQTQSFRFFNRGPSQVVRLVFFLLLSLLLLFVDARFKYLESARGILSVPVQLLQRLATYPSELWGQANAYLVTQGSLVRDNEQLRQQHALDAAGLQQLQLLEAENRHLRDLLYVQQQTTYPMHLAEIAYLAHDIFNRKLLLARRENSTVTPGQVVIDEMGVVGQVTRIYPMLDEVTLITDKDHAVPVQILRNGLRAITFGSGDISTLALRYLPISSDVQEGDVLVTSGIDGTYPPGLPVAKVTRIERDPAYPFARIECTPIAGVDRHRQLMILSGLPQLPERPKPADEPRRDTGKDHRKKP